MYDILCIEIVREGFNDNKKVSFEPRYLVEYKIGRKRRGTRAIGN